MLGGNKPQGPEGLNLCTKVGMFVNVTFSSMVKQVWTDNAGDATHASIHLAQRTNEYTYNLIHGGESVCIPLRFGIPHPRCGCFNRARWNECGMPILILIIVCADYTTSIQSLPL